MTTQQDTPTALPNRRMYKELITNPTGRIPYILADDPDAPIPYVLADHCPNGSDRTS